MRKKGFLFTLLVIVVVCLVLYVTFNLLFNIRTFEVYETRVLQNSDKTQMTTYMSKYEGVNTFAFDKDEFKGDIEKEFPYIKVVNVERVPFSTVKVTVEERMPLYCINYNSNYYFFDIDGYLVDNSNANTSGDGEFPCIEVTGITSDNMANLDECLGTQPDFIVNNDKMQYVVDFFNLLKRLDTPYTEYQIKGFIKSVDINHANDLDMTTTYYQTRLLIYDFSTLQEEKVVSLIGTINTGHATEPDHTLIVGNDLKVIYTK